MAQLDSDSKALLVDFLANGKVGPLVLGHSMAHVKNICGEPDDVYSPCRGLGVLYFGRSAGGPLQVTVDSGDVKQLQICFRGYRVDFRVGRLPRFIWPSSLLGIKTIKRLMKAHQILWSVIIRKKDDLVLRTAVGTELYFQKARLISVYIARNKPVKKA